MKLKLGILAWDITLYKVLFLFESDKIAIVTYSFHRLIMGKVEIGNFCRLIVDIWIFFIVMFIE